MNKIDKLCEIADRYNTSKPVSGNWDTETEHELNAISKELEISKQEAKQLMIKELGFDESMFDGISITSSRNIISSQEPSECKRVTEVEGSSYVRNSLFKIKPNFPEDDVVRYPEELAKETADNLKDAGYDAKAIGHYVEVNANDSDKSELSRWGTIINSRIIKYDTDVDLENEEEDPFALEKENNPYIVGNCSFCGAHGTDTVENFLKKYGFEDIDYSCDILDVDPLEEVCEDCFKSWLPELNNRTYSEYEDVSGIDTRTGEPFHIKSSRIEKNEYGEDIEISEEADTVANRIQTTEDLLDFLDNYDMELPGNVYVQGDRVITDGDGWTDDCSIPMYVQNVMDNYYFKDKWSSREVQSSRQIKSGVENLDKIKEFEKRYAKIKGDIDKEEDLIQYYVGRYDIPEETLDEIAFNLRINSSRQIKSGLDPYLCCPNCGEPELFENIKEHNIKCYNCGNTISYDELKNLKKYVSPHSKINSARYIATDPETGEVLGSADTYEEAVNEWGEDVTITDSEATKGQQEENGLFSSWDNDTPRGKGWLAHDDGKQKNECPYERGTEEYEDWIDGWEAAYQEVNSSCKPIKSSISAAALEEQLDGQFWTRAEDFEDEVNEAGWDIEDVNNEYATISNDKGSQYEVRFYDHGEGRTFTMESFKCIYCDEDDDYEIESSNQLNGDKAFLSNIVSSVLTQSMTKEQAVKRIALRNNCNQAFAKNILSNAMEDTSLIQSGIMAIADDINKDFNIDGDIESWFTDYVPKEGTANTVGGEILRAFAQIRGRYYNDGDKIGVGIGKDTVNPAARYLVDKCVGWTEVSNIEEMLSGDSDINKGNNSYEEWLEDCEYSLEDYLRNNEDYFHTVNRDGMWDYKTEQDNSESIDEVFIMDDDDNEYWFQGGGDGWYCYTINYSHEPKYHVDEWVDDLYDIPDTSGDFCDFELDGFEYSAEKSSNGQDWMITDVRLPNGIVQVDEEWETSDFEPYDIYNNQGVEISINDLY